MFCVDVHSHYTCIPHTLHYIHPTAQVPGSGLVVTRSANKASQSSYYLDGRKSTQKVCGVV
jgi:hypothetical protein